MGERTGTGEARFSPWLAAAIISGLFFIFGLIVIDDFGITWDEPVHFAAADRYLDVIGRRGLGAEFTGEDFTHSMQFYGPVFDIWGAVNHRIFTRNLGWLPPDNSRHLHLLISASLAVLFTFLLIDKAAGRRPAVFGTLFLIFFPRFLGHSFNNPKDIPIALIYLLVFYLFWLRFESGNRKLSFLIAFFGGIGFATRFQYIILPVIILLFIILYNQNRNKRNIFQKITAFWDVFLALLLSFPVGLLFWPYFWSDPIVKLNRLFNFYYFHPVQAQLSILYQGRFYTPGVDLPWHYAPVMLALTTPILIAGFFILAIIFLGLIRFARMEEAEKFRLKNFYLFSLIWIIVGLIPFILPGQRVYGGIRHFLFIVPAVCGLAGLGLDRLSGYLERRVQKAAGILIAVPVFCLLIFSVISYHPYYTVYYNCLIGGPRGALGRYPLEQWGNALKSACHWLNENVPYRARLISLPLTEVPRFYLRDDISILDPIQARSPLLTYDYSLYFIRSRDPLRVKDKNPVFSISVKNQPIVKVHQWRDVKDE